MSALCVQGGLFNKTGGGLKSTVYDICSDAKKCILGSGFVIPVSSTNRN